ncbi:MAG: RDD family protein [Actinobacteria bacterium]|nr:MAG: RDD family protein [Actinomycetota bacterium]
MLLMRRAARGRPVGKNARVTFYPATPVMPAGDPTAVVGRRIGAAVINGVILFIVLVFVARVVVDLKREDLPPGISGSQACDLLRGRQGINFRASSNDKVVYSENSSAGWLVVGIPLLVWFAMSGLLQGATGANIGKHIVGLRVIKKDTGRLASFGPNILRWVVGVLDAGCCFPIGLVMIATTKGHRRLGDMAANTLVVGKDSVGVTPVVPGLTAPQFTGPYATGYPPAGSPFTPRQPASPPAGWPAPSPAAAAPPPPAAAPSATPAANTPTWDPQRNTYVIFDSAQNHWLQWDATSQQWRPIS